MKKKKEKQEKGNSLTKKPGDGMQETCVAKKLMAEFNGALSMYSGEDMVILRFTAAVQTSLWTFSRRLTSFCNLQLGRVEIPRLLSATVYSLVAPGIRPE